MKVLLITVGAFALINYSLKAVGPVFMPARGIPAAGQLVMAALPLALLCGMLITSVIGDGGAKLDPSLLAGLAAATAAWALRAGHLACVAICVGATALVRALG